MLFSIGAFYTSLFPPDEPKYVDAALRMISNHNYIIPFFNCHVRFDKPILFYWELVASFKLFFVNYFINKGIDPAGIIEYASRLPSIIAASFSSIFVYKLSKKLFDDDNIAKFAVLGFISNGFFIYLPRAATPDMSLTFFALAALYYFIEERFIIAWILTALSFLTKGPIGPVMVGVTYIIYLILVSNENPIKKFFEKKNLTGFAIFFIVGLPWYVAVYKMYGYEFINKFLLYHNIERFTGTAHQHPRSFFYYFPVVVGVVYLWYPFVYDIVKSFDFKDKFNRFLILWFLWIFLFFSISANKLAHYIAFGTIPLSIIFGRYILSSKQTLIRAKIFFVIEFLAAMFSAYYFYKIHYAFVGYWLLFGLFVVALLNFQKTPQKVVFYKTVAITVAFGVLLLQLDSLRAEKKIWRMVKFEHARVYQFAVFNESFVAYTRHCLREIRNPALFGKLKGSFYIYTRPKYLKYLSFKYKIAYRFFENGRTTLLLRVDNG
ncbi:ArnT family glycosyltransferase [Hippea jasoniae]|uniref:ArnT family glycosyltransferase n=1 Tax=Hippea jasoniae TaxID=944479 RepID=UPI001E289EB0|nr:glycosyltransferase family 39 protein [Hippea jasoniae]